MASAVICLSKGQNFNFSKYIFDSLVSNVDSSSKFYMYPRFIQLIIQNQVGDLSTYTTRYISPALTQKVFANMRRVEKGFSRVETPLFEEQSLPPQQPQSSPQAPPQATEFLTHIQQVLDACSAFTRHVENLEHDKAAQKLEIIKLKARVKRLESNKVKSSKLRRLRKAEKQAEIYNLDLDHPFKVLNVVTAASQDSAASATIFSAKPSIPAAAPTVVAAYTRRRKEVIIRDPEEELSLKTPAKTPKLKDKGKEINQDHEEIDKDIDWDAEINHVNQKSKNPQYIKRYQGMKKTPQTESEARKNMMIYLKNTAGYKMDFFKGMSYAEICLIFQARFDENMRFLFTSREEMEEEDQEVIKSINETPAQKATKRRKLNAEAQEAKDLKKHLELVDDEDDDVFIEATPLVRKVPVVDYQIVLIDNKPRFKIIRADETHQLYISFITLLKNFDREDLENLWGIVKERFFTSKPTNFLISIAYS
nr:hypothetical protein [Tanacetum cinerariifolium]